MSKQNVYVNIFSKVNGFVLLDFMISKSITWKVVDFLFLDLFILFLPVNSQSELVSCECFLKWNNEDKRKSKWTIYIDSEWQQSVELYIEWKVNEMCEDMKMGISIKSIRRVIELSCIAVSHLRADFLNFSLLCKSNNIFTFSLGKLYDKVSWSIEKDIK